MNHIKKLQQDNQELQDQINAAREELKQFRIHLRSSKFTGTSQDGSRLDWISTSDVETRLEHITSALRGIN